jgi:mono/diheme cytochrome c family protein
VRWVIGLLVLAALVWWFVFRTEYVVATGLATPVQYSAQEGYDEARAREAWHFMYGSIGSEGSSGLPTLVLKALPVIYDARMNGRGWSHFGFLQEEGEPLPIGFSRRRVAGIERAWLNCSVCHVSTVRDGEERRLVLGGPANNLRLHEFIEFLLFVGRDPGFDAETVIAAVNSDAVDGHLGPFGRLLYRMVVVPRVRDALLGLNDSLDFVSRQHDWGPGRVDTFNPYKALQFSFPMGPEAIDEVALNGASDYPSLWQQRPREGMRLHWDGNNTSVDERNLSAALGAGVTPLTVDVSSIERVREWMWELEAPPFPREIDRAAAARGEAIFSAMCADCHGMRPLGEPGERLAYDYDRARHTGLGEVVPLSDIGTDPGRWASYTPNFAAAQNLLFAGTPHRFRHFRKTAGYASHPLDGIWARSPYLHNGSVPTLRDLLEPADRRPESFHRGGDAFDFEKVGYSGEDEPADTVAGRLFLYDTSVPGNANTGHEGPRYGTDLPDADKDALVEYMKTL